MPDTADLGKATWLGIYRISKFTWQLHRHYGKMFKNKKQKKHDVKHKCSNSRTPRYQKTDCECRKATKRRSEGISPQGMQLPIVTSPRTQLQGIGRGGAGTLQEDAEI